MMKEQGVGAVKDDGDNSSVRSLRTSERVATFFSVGDKAVSHVLNTIEDTERTEGGMLPVARETRGGNEEHDQHGPNYQSSRHPLGRQRMGRNLIEHCHEKETHLQQTAVLSVPYALHQNKQLGNQNYAQERQYHYDHPQDCDGRPENDQRQEKYKVYDQQLHCDNSIQRYNQELRYSQCHQQQEPQQLPQHLQQQQLHRQQEQQPQQPQQQPQQHPENRQYHGPQHQLQQKYQVRTYQPQESLQQHSPSRLQSHPYRQIQPNVDTKQTLQNSIRSMSDAPLYTHPSASSVVVASFKQQGNPVLRYFTSVPYMIDNIHPDYLVGKNSCVLFLTLKFHRFYPHYLQKRLRNFDYNYYGRKFLLVLVDIEDPDTPLGEVTLIAFNHGFQLFLAASHSEAAGVLQMLKMYENKSADMILAKLDTNHTARCTEVLTVLQSINKTDVVTLSRTFSTMKNIFCADANDFEKCPGIGPKKVATLIRTFRDPFFVDE